ncbi:unnamed protein product [Microthlaspi erraticum]|uniref:Uncharacterized protein n=1 Tax=Microthlaspi erraticum TaxID=1685480 RepID=A0A6D2K192_9BRAS|nr:unnamed protein product [Microthlaspi erraticum]
MEVMEIAGKYPLRAPTTLALEMEFIGVGWISLGNDPMASKLVKVAAFIAFYFNSTLNSIELGYSVPTRLESLVELLLYCFIYLLHCITVLVGLLEHLEHMGREEQGRTWCMDAAQLDTQRKKEEAILKTSSTSTRPAKLQLDRAEKSKSNPKNVASPLTSL